MSRGRLSSLVLACALSCAWPTCSWLADEPRWQATILDGQALDGNLAAYDDFGHALAAPGDVDGDGVPDLIVGAPFDDTEGENHGVLWLITLQADGTPKSAERITVDDSSVAPGDLFGLSVAVLDPAGGERPLTLAVGSSRTVHWSQYRPVSGLRGILLPQLEPHAGVPWEPGSDAVRIVQRDDQGRFREVSRIGDSQGGFDASLGHSDQFGAALAAIGDIDGNGVRDLAVGAPGSGFQGGVWILLLNEDFEILESAQLDISMFSHRPKSIYAARFGSALTWTGDAEGGGVSELIVGAPGIQIVAESQEESRGSIWAARLVREDLGHLNWRRVVSPGSELPDHSGTMLVHRPSGHGGVAAALLVGSRYSEPAGSGRVWIAELDGDRVLSAVLPITPPWEPRAFDQFGRAACRVPDMDGDGIDEWALGVPGRDGTGDEPAPDEGAVVLYLSDAD